MGKLRNPMKTAREVKIDKGYYLSCENMIEVIEKSKDSYELYCNAFRLGYAQGIKATKSKIIKSA